MRLFGSFLFTFIVYHGFAQQTSDGVSFGFNYLPSKILIHTPRVYLAPNAFPQAFEISYKKQTLGNKEWHQKYGFPEVALNLTYSNYDYSYFGNAIGFYPSIQFKVLQSEKLNWYFKMGGGLGIISKHWIRESPIDTFIGSKLNNFTMFQTGIHFALSKKITAQFGAHFYHVSNAATRKPNYGINAIGVFLGVNYHPKNVTKRIEKRIIPKHKNPFNIGVQSTIGFLEARANDGPLYPVYFQSLFASKMYRNKNKFSFGFTATYNSLYYATIRNSNRYPNRYWEHSWRYSLNISNEFIFGKIGFPLQLGFYLNHPLSRNLMYQKLGLNYHFYKNTKAIFKDIYGCLLLNTHTSRAQNAELGLGFLF
jgi:hypothetical protein